MTDYKIRRFNPYTKEELISALKEFAKLRQVKYLAAKDFCDWSGVSETTVSRHFGKWSSFCEEAGLDSRYKRTKSRADLLVNLGKVWEKLGRQPRAKQMKQPLSPMSCSRYLKEFGSWYQTCLEFLSWKSGMSVEDIANEAKAKSGTHSPRRKTKRGISLALRYEVLKRDGFRCVVCGRSPATEHGVLLHIDHIQPWARGGETEGENLRTLCQKCNLGKSDKTGN